MSSSSQPATTYEMDDIDLEDNTDAMSDASSIVFNPSVTSTRTTDESMRSLSPAPSVYSMTSSLRAQAFRSEYGRSVNNYSDIYRLPADDEELDRLDKQHIMFLHVMGKYPPPLPDILADEGPQSETKQVLDVGCGSGSWILDVARDFPHISAVAVDLIPMQSLALPPNCRSEVDDVNLGLEHFYDDFNVVHARLVSSGIKDYATLIDHMVRCLRPNGLLEVAEFDFRVYRADKTPFYLPTAHIEPPYFPRWMTFMNSAARSRGGNVDAANLLHTWVKAQPSMKDVTYREFWFPISPWLPRNSEENIRQNKIGQLMRADILSFLKAGRPLLLGSGLNVETVNLLEAQSMRELNSGSLEGYIRVETVYAIKQAPRRAN